MTAANSKEPTAGAKAGSSVVIRVWEEPYDGAWSASEAWHEWREREEEEGRRRGTAGAAGAGAPARRPGDGAGAE